MKPYHHTKMQAPPGFHQLLFHIVEAPDFSPGSTSFSSCETSAQQNK